MSVQDFIKNSILESGVFDGVSITRAALGLITALLMGAVIYFVYRKFYTGVIYSRSFAITLVGMTVLTAMVTLAISTNIVISLGMVGALSIVRFRTAIKDARDTMYIFWAIIVGICCGVSDFLVAGIGSGIVFALLLIFGSIKNDKRMLLIIRADRALQESIQATVFNIFERRAMMRVRNTTKDKVEMIYEISSEILRKAELGKHSVCDKIYEIGDIEYVNLVMQNDEVSG
jgi:hypothetical protein